MRKQGLRAVPLLMLAVCSVAHAAVTRSVSPVGDRRSSSTLQQENAYASYASGSTQIKHVSTSGSDTTGTGTSANPWRTVARAVRSLSPGDTLYIHAGTYTDTEVDLAGEGAVNGTPSAPIVLKRAPGEARPVLRASGVGPVFTLNRNYWVLSGLEVDGRYLRASAVVIPTAAHHVTLRDSLVRDTGKDALVIQGNNIYVYNNEIRNTLEAVDGSSPGASCTTHASCGTGNFCKPRYSSGNLVRSCQPRDDGHAISLISNSHSVLIRDNVIHDATGDGMQCSGPLQGYVSGNRPYDITLEDNDIYTSPEHFGATENAVDVKDCDHLTLRRERYHGFRPTTGEGGNNSAGGAVVFHVTANRVLMEDSAVFDACNALGTGNNSGDTVGNIVIRRNRFHDMRTSDGCASGAGHALGFEKLSHADIYHNTFANIPGRVLRMGQTWPVSDVDFWNNIVATSSSNGRWMSVLSANVSGFDAAANLYWNSGGATSQFSCDGTTMDLAAWRTSSCDEVTDFEAGSLAAVNPGFVDAADDDYQLQATSPAIDEALDNTSSTVCGAAPDIGAFERCQGGGEPTVYWHAGNFRYLPQVSGDLATFVDQLEHPNAAGFGKVSTTREGNFTTFLDALFAAITASRNDGNTGDWCGVRAAADAAGYEVQRFYDTVSGRWFIFGYDTTGFGHAYFFINPYAKRNLVVEVPHEPSEIGTGVQGARLFTSLAARALIINKEHRCSDPDATTCSGTTSSCGGAYRESDVAHHERNTFHLLHRRFNDMDPATRFVQLHGMTGSSTDMAVIADSSTSDFDARSVSVAFANALDGYVPSASAVDSCQEYVGDPPSDFCATTNLQGRYSNDPALNACTAYTPNTTNRFLSVEQAASLRDDDESDGYSWMDVRDALKVTWPQCDMNNGATDCTVGPRQTQYTDLTCL